MRGLDKDCDSTIDLHEFASRFDPVFTRLNAKQDVRNTCSIFNLPIALLFSSIQSARFDVLVSLSTEYARNSGTLPT